MPLTRTTRTTRRGFLRTVGLGAAGAALPWAGARAGRRPNVVFILADDLGWRDTSLYGSTFYETPNIDALAARGVTFTNAYAANPLCSPTRASILTGQYPGRLRFTTPSGHLKQSILDPRVPDRAPPFRKRCTPQSRTRLPNEYFTIAEALKEAGYRTGFFGKWHLGRDPYLPDNQGFDVVVGGREHPGPPGGYFSPWPCETLPKVPPGKHICDVLTDAALGFLRGSKERPFFLCLWYYDVHAPFQGKEELIEKYRRKVDPASAQRCPTMGAMIEVMDRNIGRVTRTVDELGIAEDTIVVFTSDNGGNMYNTIDGTTPTDNSPLRGGKGTIYEGGTREPLVVVWPGTVRHASRCDEIVSSIDHYPTILEMTGIPRKDDMLLDGVSMVPALRGGGLRREAIFCHFPHDVPATGNVASTYVRKGEWKLIRFHCDGPGGADRLELHNLKDDIGETRDLADAMPERAKELDKLITMHLADTKALVPKPNPAYVEPAGGWSAMKDCRLSLHAYPGGDRVLRVECTGGDPHLQTSSTLEAAGPATLTLRMKSGPSGSNRGDGQVFWGKSYHRSRRVTFRMVHDGRWHEYEVKLPAKGALRRLRLDPGSGPPQGGTGLVEIDHVRLVGPDGRVLREWDF